MITNNTFRAPLYLISPQIENSNDETWRIPEEDHFKLELAAQKMSRWMEMLTQGGAIPPSIPESNVRFNFFFYLELRLFEALHGIEETTSSFNHLKFKVQHFVANPVKELSLKQIIEIVKEYFPGQIKLYNSVFLDPSRLSTRVAGRLLSPLDLRLKDSRALCIDSLQNMNLSCRAVHAIVQGLDPQNSYSKKLLELVEILNEICAEITLYSPFLEINLPQTLPFHEFNSEHFERTVHLFQSLETYHLGSLPGYFLLTLGLVNTAKLTTKPRDKELNHSINQLISYFTDKVTKLMREENSILQSQSISNFLGLIREFNRNNLQPWTLIDSYVVTATKVQNESRNLYNKWLKLSASIHEEWEKLIKVSNNLIHNDPQQLKFLSRLTISVTNANHAFDTLIIPKCQQSYCLKKVLYAPLQILSSIKKESEAFSQHIKGLTPHVNSTIYTYFDLLTYQVELSLPADSALTAAVRQLLLFCRKVSHRSYSPYFKERSRPEILEHLQHVKEHLGSDKKNELLDLFLNYLESSESPWLALLPLFEISGTKAGITIENRATICEHLQHYRKIILTSVPENHLKALATTVKSLKSDVKEAIEQGDDWFFPFLEHTIHEQKMALKALLEKIPSEIPKTDLEELLRHLNYHHNERFYSSCFNTENFNVLVLCLKNKYQENKREEIKSLIAQIEVLQRWHQVRTLAFAPLEGMAQTLPSPPRPSSSLPPKTKKTEMAEAKATPKRRRRQKKELLSPHAIKQMFPPAELIRMPLSKIKRKSISASVGKEGEMLLPFQRSSSAANLEWYLTLSEELLECLKKEKIVRTPLAFAFLMTHLGSLMLEQSFKLALVFSSFKGNSHPLSHLHTKHDLASFLSYVKLPKTAHDFIQKHATGLYAVRTPSINAGAIATDLIALLNQNKNSFQPFVQRFYSSLEATSQILQTLSPLENIVAEQSNIPPHEVAFQENHLRSKSKDGQFLAAIYDELATLPSGIPNCTGLLFSLIPSFFLEESAATLTEFRSYVDDHDLSWIARTQKDLDQEQVAILNQHPSVVSHELRYPCFSQGKTAENIRKLHLLTSWERAIVSEWVTPEVQMERAAIRSQFKKEPNACLEEIQTEITILLREMHRIAQVKIEMARGLRDH